VIPYGLNGDLPSLYCVAAFAGCAHLPVMNVGVTIPAPCAGVGEDWFGVALSASDVLVHPEKGEAGFEVIKFRNSAYRFPSENGVAILTGSVQVAVGAARGDGAASLSMSQDCHRAHQNSGDCDKPKHPGTRPTTQPHDVTSLCQLIALGVPNDDGGTTERMLLNHRG